MLARRDSIAMNAQFCVEALNEAIACYAVPEIMNADQGSKFTSANSINALTDRSITASVDGRGQRRDNVCVERLWRTVKCEEIYLRDYESVSAARDGIPRYLAFFNSQRAYSADGGEIPDMVYFNTLAAARQAAWPRKTGFP